jgi:glucokinase
VRGGRGAAGRRTVDAGGPALLADLGATHLRIAVADGGDIGSVVVRRTADLAIDPLEGIAPAVVQAMAEAWRDQARGSGTSPGGTGIGVAAYVGRDGSILQGRPFGLLPGPALRDRLAAAFGGRVVVDNDANLAALGEGRSGAGRGCDDFLLITLGTNIGLGIVAGGRLVRGAHGAAGEPGNLLVAARRGRRGTDPRAVVARLGTGLTDAPAGYAWLEDLVGGGALAGAAARADAAVGGERAFVRAVAGDRHAAAVVHRAVEGWAMLIANLVVLFDPERIILSGALVEDARPYLEPLRRRATALSLLPPDIRIGELGARAGLVGAAVAARSAPHTERVPAVTRERTGLRSQSRPGQRPSVMGR